MPSPPKAPKNTFCPLESLSFVDVKFFVLGFLKRDGDNKRSKRSEVIILSWIPSVVYPREGGGGNDKRGATFMSLLFFIVIQISVKYILITFVNNNKINRGFGFRGNYYVKNCHRYL
jgi:hypothetical protein